MYFFQSILIIYFLCIYNSPTVSHRMQPSIQNSTTQTARQVTRFLNSVQQRNFTNNQSLLSQVF